AWGGDEGRATINFSDLKERLLSQARILLPQWLSGGVWRGSEFKAGNLRGDRGESLSVNSLTGAWADFATGEKGGDLIALYAAIKELKQSEAARDLGGETYQNPAPSAPIEKPAARRVIAPVPDGTARHDCIHGRFGAPARVWDYLDKDGKLLGHVARYAPPTGKEFIPYTLSLGDNGAYRWGGGQWPKPRPLYGLRELHLRPDDPVLIVEGEKAADAARLICPRYVVVTWPGGATAWKMADFSAVYRRKDVLLWPDNDDPGLKAMWDIGHLLQKHCQVVKIILPEGVPAKFDAADCVALKWTWVEFSKWARPLTRIIGHVDEPVKITETIPAPAATPEGDSPDGRVTRDEIIDKRPHQALWYEWKLNVSTSGIVASNLNNVMRVLENDPRLKGLVWYDEFLQRMLCPDNALDETGAIIKRSREWGDGDDLNTTLYMQRTLGITAVDRRIVAQAVQLVALRDRRNCVKDWIGGLEWDGVPRIEHFFPENFGAEDNEYTRAVSRNFWLSMLARIYMPGCKVDNMIVLEGGQGGRKSTAMEIIGGNWYATPTENVYSKDFYICLSGKIVVEIAEMDSFSKAEVTKVKQVVSNKSDRYRSPYARNAEDHPRQGIFCGTTNRDDWNRDETGARRFWPIKCVGDVNIEWIKRNRDQLFAEARALIMQPGVTWWQTPLDLTKMEQDARMLGDIWAERVHEVLSGKYCVTAAEILNEMKVETSRQDRTAQTRIASIMRAAGWAKVRRSVSKGGPLVWAYEKPPQQQYKQEI
ncbi:MAG: VapE domain-containing protein, partial [Alphaproteobacteria bacterium]